MAAIGNQAVCRLSVVAEQRRDSVSNLRINGDLAAEEAAAHISVEQLHVIDKILVHALIEQGDVMERIDIDLQIARVVLRQDEIRSRWYFPCGTISRMT